LWPQLFSDVDCIALWISSEKILTRLYSVLHWFHKRLEANVKNPRENRCFQTIIVFSFGSFYNSNKCTVLWKIAASLITVSTSVNKEMWVKLSLEVGMDQGGPQQLMGIGDAAVAMVLFQTGGTMDLGGGEVGGAVQRQQVMAVQIDEAFEHLAALQATEDLAER